MRVAIFSAAVAFAGLTLAVADDEKHIAVKNAEDWLYPSSKTGSSSQSGPISCVIQKTTDDIPAILKHYGKKFGMDLTPFGKQGISGGGFESKSFVLSSPPDGGQEGNTAHVLTMTTKGVCATVVIERPRAAKTTSITVTVTPFANSK